MSMWLNKPIEKCHKCWNSNKRHYTLRTKSQSQKCKKIGKENNDTSTTKHFSECFTNISNAKIEKTIMKKTAGTTKLAPKLTILLQQIKATLIPSLSTNLHTSQT